jgi:hypothetical protein
LSILFGAGIVERLFLNRWMYPIKIDGDGIRGQPALRDTPDGPVGHGDVADWR